MGLGKEAIGAETENLLRVTRKLIDPKPEVDVEDINTQLVELFGKDAPEFKKQKKAPDEIIVFPENKDAIDLFLECSTQWKFASVGLGGLIRTGLDYPGVNVLINVFYPDADKKVLFQKLRVIENEALRIFNKE